MNTGYRDKTRRSRPAGHKGQGFSLIEVLVVLVVLVVGIFSIARLFPGGFFTIQRTGEMTSAQALSGQQLDVQKSQLGIPESVVAVQRDPNTGALIVDPNVTPNDLTDLNVQGMNAIGLNGGPDTYFGNPYYWSNINRIRHIIGETFRVPTPSPNSGKGFGAIYMLQHGPVFNQLGLDSNGNPSDSLSVYGAPMERIEQSATVGQDNTDSNLVLNNANQYAIDYDKGLIAFYPRAGTSSRQFRITYDYYVAGSNGSPYALQSVVDGPGTVITVPDDNTVPAGVTPLPRWVSLFGTTPNHLAPPTGFIAIRRESEDVSRKFRLVSATPVNTNSGGPNNPNFTADPFEYAWYSPQKPTDTDDANVGVLIFNPHGHDQLIPTSAGPQPITVRVDYTSFDNHIVREDRSVPNQGPYFVKLSLPFVLTNGDILSDQTPDTGMFRLSSAPTPDILIYNANTGDEIGEYTNNKAVVNANDPALAGLTFNVDTRSGTITFNPTASTSSNYAAQLSLLQSATLRFYYRALHEWGMQIQKANAHYIQSFDPAQDMTYHSYYVGGTQSSDNASKTRIYFPLCEAGKSVVLGEYWAGVNDSSGNPVLDSNGKPLLRHFSGEMYKINDNASLFQSLNGKLLTWIDVLSQHPEAGSSAVNAKNENWQFTAAGTGQGAVSNIQGGSIKSRIIWKDGERWRMLDNDTFLPAASGH